MYESEPTSPRSPGHELFHQHIKDGQYEREDVQKKTFGKWINSQLTKINCSLVTDLFYDLRDGTRLLALLSVLTGRSYKPEKGRMRVHHLNNVSTAFRVLEKYNVKLVNISNNDIVDGNPKLTLGLVWSIILHWQVQDVLKGNMAELQPQSNLDKTLLNWCQEATKDYSDVNITNFTTSWSDGLAFLALIHRFRPDLFDYEIVSRKPANSRLDYAFRVANKTLGIARLLDPEDVNTTTPDKKSIMMYVMCLYQALPHTSLPLFPSSPKKLEPDGTTADFPMGDGTRSTSAASDPVDFTAYQTLMEEVLVWLLAAEDHLDSAPAIDVELQTVKEQFHKHEEFLLELSSQQGSIGVVLQEGTRLLQEGKLSEEEESEIRIQMRLLNSRWDQLRTKAMDRQARIHETLTKLQQDQLEKLRHWLTSTEDRISQLATGQQPDNLTAAVRMLEDHEALQRDLEAQQEDVNALSNMVVIVDENADCSQMEDQLSALGERWSHVCQWADQRASALQQLVSTWEQLDQELQRVKTWLAGHEQSLRLIEANPSTDRSQMADVARQLQLLDRDLEPHQQRLNQLQESVQRLPPLIQAVVGKEQSKRKLTTGTYKCVDRILQDMEDLEDRIEALNEIMEAQRQRLGKSGVSLNMVILPPDITTSLTAFDDTDVVIKQQPKDSEDEMLVKKRKLNSDRRHEFEEAVDKLKNHLDNMEQLVRTGCEVATLEQTQLEHKPDLDQVLKSGHVLIGELQNDMNEVCKVEDDMTSLTERWLIVEELLKQRDQQQQEADRRQVLNQMEVEFDAVLDETITLSLDSQKNEEAIIKLKALWQSATEHVKGSSDLSSEEREALQVELDSLSVKMDRLQEKISGLDKDVVMFSQLKEESQSLDKWMKEVQSFLTAEDVAWGDVETLEAQLEQSNALQDDVRTLEPSVTNINYVVQVLTPKADEALLVDLSQSVERLNSTWTRVITEAKQKNRRLKEALDTTRRMVDGLNGVHPWIDELEADIPASAVINSTSELSQTLRKLNSLKNRVDLKAADYKSVVDAGNLVLSHQADDVKDRLDKLTQRWNQICGGILERHRALKAASHHYGEFKVLTAQECDWQDKLEKKLLRSTTLAADAEEISEELDDLENYMKNRPKARLLRIESMGNELVSLNIMADSVGQEVRSLTERWASLIVKAKDKAEWLENRVRGAQQCEQRLVQLHNAINRIDVELCANLEQDLYGDELPDLCQRLSDDIAQQEALLAEIRDEEHGYEAEGRKEAANRLHEQLSFIELSLQDVKTKFRKFQNPSDLEPRLERMLRVLRDLEQGMCYIELASDDGEAIEGQLNNCLRFYASLSDIKAEVEAILREGRQAVEDGQMEDHITVSGQLDAMKALYNRLGEQVAVARETLERAMQLSVQLNVELNSLNDWLNHLEAEIHKREGEFTEKPNRVEEIRFYEKHLEELIKNQTQRDAIRENFESFCGLCDISLLDILRERVDDINQEWQRIEDRLRSKVADLQEDSASEDAQQPQEDPHRQTDSGGEAPARMYRSIVYTTVRQFTNPDSPVLEKTYLEIPSPTLQTQWLEIGDQSHELEQEEQSRQEEHEEEEEQADKTEDEDEPADKTEDEDEQVEKTEDGEEDEDEDVEEDEDGDEDEDDDEDFAERIRNMSRATANLASPVLLNDFGYFNAAFEDFDDTEREMGQESSQTLPSFGTLDSLRTLEVARGDIDSGQLAESSPDDSSAESTDDSRSSSSNESSSDSVKHVAETQEASAAAQEPAIAVESLISMVSELDELMAQDEEQGSEEGGQNDNEDDEDDEMVDHDDLSNLERLDNWEHIDVSHVPTSPTATVLHVIEVKESQIYHRHIQVETQCSQLPVAEVPRVEIVNSRPLTPENALDSEPSVVSTPTPPPYSGTVDTEQMSCVERVLSDGLSDTDNIPKIAMEDSSSPAEVCTPPPTPAFDAFAGINTNPFATVEADSVVRPHSQDDPADQIVDLESEAASSPDESCANLGEPETSPESNFAETLTDEAESSSTGNIQDDCSQSSNTMGSVDADDDDEHIPDTASVVGATGALLENAEHLIQSIDEQTDLGGSRPRSLVQIPQQKLDHDEQDELNRRLSGTSASDGPDHLAGVDHSHIPLVKETRGRPAVLAGSNEFLSVGTATGSEVPSPSSPASLSDASETIVIRRRSRKVSRDEGTQTDLCGIIGHVHAQIPVSPSVTPESAALLIKVKVPLQVESDPVNVTPLEQEQQVETEQQPDGKTDADDDELESAEQQADETRDAEDDEQLATEQQEETDRSRSVESDIAELDDQSPVTSEETTLAMVDDVEMAVADEMSTAPLAQSEETDLPDEVVSDDARRDDHAVGDDDDRHQPVGTTLSLDADPLISPTSENEEVFVSEAEATQSAAAADSAARGHGEDADSFYGSDKEVDEAVEFSQTDSSASSPLSSESEMEPEKSGLSPPEKSSPPSVQVDVNGHHQEEDGPFSKEIAEFETQVALMLKRMEHLSTSIAQSSSSMESECAEMELTLLEPDVATLISRGDSLVLQVQTSDLERALRINATTGDLRAARAALKAGNEVRRQRVVEQEEMLKECQQQTQQLQSWLTNIARTLDEATRLNDQSQLQALEEELNRRQSDIRQLTEAAGKLQERQVLEYQALIGTLTVRWQELQSQFQDFQKKEKSSADLVIMGGPDFVTRVNKLREAISSVSRQLHCPPLNLKHYEQLSGQEDSLKAIKSALATLKNNVDTLHKEKDDAVNASQTTDQKEQIQRVLDKLRDEWTLLNKAYTDKQSEVQQSLTTWRSLHSDMKDFEEWLNNAEAALSIIQGDGLNRTERKEKLKQLESQVTARHKVMSNITSTCREVWFESCTADAVLLREKQETLGKKWRALLSGLAGVRQRLTSLDGSPVQVAKLNAVITPGSAAASRKDEAQQGTESLASSEASATCKETPTPTPGTIVASLDKSILQIRDWLTVLETMLKQQVVIVGDSEDVLLLLEKQKNVLRELEQKKPQLDELVQTAESIKDGGPPTGKQLPAQVSKLRDHWEETSVAVTARKNQLESMLSDSNQFEHRRQDVDQWLGRMETRISKLAPVAGTADLIDAQHREQKVLHNEVQQYKAQVDQLNQITQRLVTSYPNDDTSRVSRVNDNMIQRYSALNSGVNARGRALNAALGSLHSYDRSLDKFMAWLSDTESSLESLELELDSYGPGVKTSRERTLQQLKELSVELDGRRDEQAGLASSGQRMINALENGGQDTRGLPQSQSNDDALMLRRRLDDMNRRWHGLRAKTVAIRNRLENNTEHWNALLLSLRELIEWVIRKDTEMTGLGPIRGDLSALVKQQDDFRAFRRQLDDKRPLIEQTILTSRQLVANEAALSDTSDSEVSRDMAGDSRAYRSAEESARDLTTSIRREGGKLAERWATLRDRTDRWSVELDTTTSRVQELQNALEEASNRLIPAEASRAQWTNAADVSGTQIQQLLDQLKELSDSLSPVQSLIEDVNDQAARLADSGVPLSHANLSRLDDLNSRWKVLQSSLDDRYAALCGATRDGAAASGPAVQSFLTQSVQHPWERSITEADVPYYINHETETTHWDHPRTEDLMNSLSDYNDVRFSAYRMALKLRQVQKFLGLDKLKLNTAIETFDAHGLRAQNDKVIDVADMITVLRSLYECITTASPPADISLPLGVDLCLNWILNVYDSQRSGEIRVLSFKVIITLMCRGHLEDKYRYLFRLIADPNRLVDAPKLGVLLHDCVQIPRELGEVAAFGGSNIEPSVKSCFEKAGKLRQSIEAVHFLAWMKQEPQSVVWLPVLHRLAASEKARHHSKCNVCKASPIIGLRYRCLKCLSFDMCQTCFFTGRVSKSHKLTHPMQEYCTVTTSGEDLKDFTRTLRNKFKSKRYFKKHPRLGYLPVHTALEGTATPSDFQSVASSQVNLHQDILVHSSSVAPSIADGSKEFTPDSEDEHHLIAQYCRSLNGDVGGSSMITPRSPAQLVAALDNNHKEEIETMIRELEEENATLQAEYERLRSQQSPSMSLSLSSSPDETTPVPHGPTGVSDVERDMLAEARLLRQHKTRLEARMKILEEHNRQLEAQLGRLRQLLDEQPAHGSSPARTGTLQTRSVTAAALATDTPVRSNGFSHEGSTGDRPGGNSHAWSENSSVDRLESRPPPPPMMNVPAAASAQQPPVVNTQNVGNLLHMAGDLGKVVGSLVTVMTDADDRSPSLSEED